MRIFEALFNGSWPKFSAHALEKGFENPHFIFCSSFPNLRLGGIKVHRKVRSIRVRSTFQILRLGGVRFMFCSSCPVLLKGACATTRRRVVCRSHCMCLSNLQDDDSMKTCLSNSQDADSNESNDSMPMCLSNSNCPTRTHKMIARRCVCRTHKMMIA